MKGLNTLKRMVTVISPKEKGKPLVAKKTAQRNNLCPFGIKVKKCKEHSKFLDPFRQ